MKTLDLSNKLKKYTKGWVAIDELTNEVIFYAPDFNSIMKRVEGKRNVFVMAVSDNYFNFVT